MISYDVEWTTKFCPGDMHIGDTMRGQGDSKTGVCAWCQKRVPLDHITNSPLMHSITVAVQPGGPYPAMWADDPQHPMSDWQYEVGNGDTLLGYRDWIDIQRAAAEAELWETEEI
jgi:hypothetical protein